MVHAAVDGDLVAEAIENPAAQVDKDFRCPFDHHLIAATLISSIHLGDHQVPLALGVEGELVDNLNTYA